MAGEGYKSEKVIPPSMGKAWVKRRKRDRYYLAAKRAQYRSRSAFKLLQMQEKYGVIEQGWTVLDLGSSPGGWSQVARMLVGDDGAVFAVDIVGMAPIEGVKFIHGDLRDVEFIEEIVSSVGAVDAVLSDMAPKLSGVKSYDQARAMDLAGIALDVARTCLREGGNFVAKAFRGDDFDLFLSRVAKDFQSAKSTAPPATSKGSSEVYVVAKGFRSART